MKFFITLQISSLIITSGGWPNHPKCVSKANQEGSHRVETQQAWLVVFVDHNLANIRPSIRDRRFRQHQNEQHGLCCVHLNRVLRDLDCHMLHPIHSLAIERRRHRSGILCTSEDSSHGSTAFQCNVHRTFNPDSIEDSNSHGHIPRSPDCERQSTYHCLSRLDQARRGAWDR